MAEPLDPTASWPRHLQASWRDCVERGEVDAQHPPESMIEAYLVVAEARTKRVSSIPWGDGTHDLADDEESLLTDLTPTRAVCARCGASELEHFYTSKRNGKALCSDCFQHRGERGQAGGRGTATSRHVPTESLGLPAVRTRQAGISRADRRVIISAHTGECCCADPPCFIRLLIRRRLHLGSSEYGGAQ